MFGKGGDTSLKDVIKDLGGVDFCKAFVDEMIASVREKRAAGFLGLAASNEKVAAVVLSLAALGLDRCGHAHNQARGHYN